MVLVVLIGLFLTSSRGAWIALLLGMGVWVLWKVSIYLSARIRKPSLLFFILLLLFLLIPALWVIGTYPGGAVGLADRLPGSASGESRFDLAVNTVKLIGDYPFTGGGLRSFPGLYSQYMMVTPYFLFSYSHNLYLDLFLEQGLFGGIAILAVVLGAAWMLIRQVRELREASLVAHLAEALLVGILIMLLHGLVDDPLYGDTGTPLLLLLPAFAIMLVNIENPPLTLTDQSEGTGYPGKDSRMRRIVIPGIVLIVFFSLVVTFRRSLIASRCFSIGAFRAPVQAGIGFQSIRTNLDLERAIYIDPDHRGIRKSLGYTYVWDSNLENAELMLQGINEARIEMEIYSWWWDENNRRDLATQASEMASILDTVNH
jgi:hypothetical protein